MAGSVEFYIPAEIQDVILDQLKKQVLYNTPGSGQVAGIWGGFEHRDALEAIDREYYRDNIYTYDKIAAGIANRAGDKKKLQDVVIPLAESQADTMLAYLTSVFLTGIPMFGVTSPPQWIDQAKAYQAILAEQETYGGWTGEFMDFFLNSLKYFGVMEVSWCREKMYAPEVAVRSNGKVDTSSTVLWQGNKCKNLSPYNFFWDHRVSLVDIPERAEYAGYVELESRTTLKKYIDSKELKMNIDKVFPRDSVPNLGMPPQKLFFVPDFFWNSLDNLGKIQNPGISGSRFVDDFSNWEVGPEGEKRIFKNAYFKVTRYVRLVPKDFGMRVPNWNQVQIWKFVTVNDQVIIEAERQNNNHDLLPLVACQPNLDGLAYNNRSFVQKQIPIQDIASALLNGALDSRRRALADRILYDPSKVTSANISSTNPTARIPCRPSAYGSDLSKAVYQFPYRDDQTQSFVGMAKEMMQFSDMISGQNKAQQGQFVKGNKTQREYEDVQAHSSGRQKKVAFKIEQQAMGKIKLILKANILQYQPSGELFNYAEEETVKVVPEELRKAIFAYKVTDGITPEDKVVNADVLQVGLQTIAASPLLQSKYDLAAAFSYMMKTQNVDLKAFELQPEQADAQLQSMAQAGLTPGMAKEKMGAETIGTSPVTGSAR